MRTLWPDLRFGARMLLKKPGFTMIVMLTLGLGIGANTAIFSVVNAVLLRALPYPQPERLAVLTEKRLGGQRMGVAYPNYQDWRERAKSFTEVAGFRGALLNLTGVDKPAQLQCRQVSWNFFRMLGVQPQLGRLFVADDDKQGAAHIVLLSHAFWQEKLGGDPDIVGKAISLDRSSYTVIGVLPVGFEFFRKDDLFIPLNISLSSADLGRGNHSGLNALARLKDWVSVEQASAEMVVEKVGLTTFRTNHRIGKEQETVSLPCGTSAFAQKYCTRRVNRMLIEGASTSIRMRSRFPLHPSLSAVDGESIEWKS